MKKMITAIFLTLFAITMANADKDIYGADGSYKGWIEKGSGAYGDKGKAQKGGDVYGSNGSYKGWVESDGSIYGADGSYKGWVEDDGSIYGADGTYKGEVEDD